MIRIARPLQAPARAGLALLVLAIASIVAAAPASADTPRAQFDWTPDAPIVWQAVSFDSAGSACGAATPCTYVWQDDGGDGVGGTQWPLGEGPTLTFTFHYVGTKYVRLKVYDSEGVLRAQTEHDVAVGSGSGSSSPPPGDTTPPDTIIDSGPADGTSTTASFAFHATSPSSFRCSLDGAAASSCSSPVSYTGLAVGSHRFSVTATDTAGNADPTPATRSWTIAAPEPSTGGACDQTVSGSAVVSAAASAPSGSTVCVTGGSYGALDFSAARSGYVTVKPASGATVTFSDLGTTGNASYYRFEGLHVTHMVDLGGRTSSTGDHIEIVRSYLSGVSVWSGMTDVLIDHNDIENGGNQLESVGGTRVTVNGNRFANAGGDAMFITSGWKDWTITNNEITGVMESGDHSDCLQSYAGGSGMVFSGNYEHDNLCQGFFIKDGAASNVTFSDNLFIRGLGTGDTTNVYDVSNLVVRNNTIADGKGFMLRGGGGPATIDHNVIDYFTMTDPWSGVTEGYDWFGQVSGLSPSSTTHVGGTPSFLNPLALDFRLTDGSGRGVDWTPAQKHFGP
jgi:hypothetical protein